MLESTNTVALFGRPCGVYPDLARLGSHFERGQPFIVLNVLQPLLGFQAGSDHEDAVVHAGDELSVFPRVVGHNDQGVQHRVSVRVLLTGVRPLVLVVQEEVHHVGLVGAGRQRQRQLTFEQRFCVLPAFCVTH